MTSLLEWKAAERTGEKKSLQLDLDPTSFISHRHDIHRNVANLVGFQLMVLFQMYDLHFWL